MDKKCDLATLWTNWKKPLNGSQHQNVHICKQYRINGVFHYIRLLGTVEYSRHPTDRRLTKSIGSVIKSCKFGWNHVVSGSTEVVDLFSNLYSKVILDTFLSNLIDYWQQNCLISIMSTISILSIISFFSILSMLSIF